MKVIILAAGSGTRLKDLTKSNPKCMVNLLNKPLVEYQLDLFKSFGINQINIVRGYKYEKINYTGIKYFLNKKYKNTNMVYTLFCAKEVLESGDDILITYGDIIFNKLVLETILKSNNELNISIDTNWKQYWEKRMDNPLKDAETLKLDSFSNIIEIGKKPKSYSEIEGQYMGLIKIKSKLAKNLYSIWESMDKNKLYDNKEHENIYMTSFIQHLINIGIKAKAVPVKSGWVEIDTPSDLIFGEAWLKSQYLIS